MSSTREEIGSALACYERFCQRASREIKAHEKATALVAKAGRERIAKEHEEAVAKSKEALKKSEEEDKLVKYALSFPRWKGVADFYYTSSTHYRRNAVLVLDEPPLNASNRENKLFPQIDVVPKHGKPVIVTMLACRGWEIAGVVVRGCNVSVEIRRA